MSQQQDKSSRNGNGPVTTEVAAKPKRRMFSATYKLRILEEADSCNEPGQIGELLRREGLYSSHLTDWRRQRKAGQLQALEPQKRGRKKDEQAAEMAALRRDNEHLRTQLSQAELIIAAQKKLSRALEAIMTGESER